MKTTALRASVEIVLNPRSFDTYRGVIYDDNGKLQHACRYERQDYSAALDDAQCLLHEINYKQSNGDEQ